MFIGWMGGWVGGGGVLSVINTLWRDVLNTTREAQIGGVGGDASSSEASVGPL